MPPPAPPGGAPPGRSGRTASSAALTFAPERPSALASSIDDFGTGHSSLVYLQRLPIDQIKIDRSFVMNLATSPGDAVIVRSTIDLAHNLGVTVVAEGVEDPLALDLLIEYGCGSAQGFYFSRPRTADDLAEWLGASAFGATTAARGLV